MTLARRDAVAELGRSPWLSVIARALAPLVVLALVILAQIQGLPHSGMAGYWETLAQAGLLAIYVLGWLLTWRWPMIGATILTVCAFGVGALSALEYPPWRGLLVSLTLFLPAGLLWLRWQREKSHATVVRLASVLVLSVGLTAATGLALWSYVQEPYTVQSTSRALPASPVRWVWSGALTSTSATVVAQTSDDDSTARLIAGTQPDLTGEVFRTDQRGGSETQGTARFRLDGLRPDTTYYYAVEVDGAVDLVRSGRFHTLAEGRQSFTLAFASCGRLRSNAAVYDTIRDAGPVMFLHTGDFFYADIGRNEVHSYRRAYDRTLSQTAQSELYRSVATVYMWDDHDFGPNNANRTSPSRDAAVSTYRQLVPYYPLVSDSPQGPIAQAFTIGRARFIVTDLRSQRDPAGIPDGPDKTMLGAQQLRWFEQQLLDANGEYPLIVWVSSVPWIQPATGGDDWGAFATERRRIADFIAEHRIRGLVMLAGDAHMIAADDGTNSDYSTSGGGGFPVLHAAALDSRPSMKGGPYSEGAFPGAGQFGLLRVDDEGSQVRVTFEGRRWDDKVLLRYSFSVPGTP